MCRVAAYYRVSSEKQGRSGLGLEAQRKSVRALCEARGWEIVAEFTEVESGKRNERPELNAALDHARLTGAKLVVAKLDRLSRDAAFTLHLRNSGVEFTCADNPDVNRRTIELLAVINEEERERISERTKAALAAAKARGVKLGNPNAAKALRRAGNGNSASLAAIQSNADRFAEGGKPFTKESFGNWFANSCDAAGLPKECRAHGLRKATLRRMAELEMTNKSMKSVSGQQRDETLALYIEQANQRKLAGSAIARLSAWESEAKCLTSDERLDIDSANKG